VVTILVLVLVLSVSGFIGITLYRARLRHGQGRFAIALSLGAAIVFLLGAGFVFLVVADTFPASNAKWLRDDSTLDLRIVGQGSEARTRVVHRSDTEVNHDFAITLDVTGAPPGTYRFKSRPRSLWTSGPWIAAAPKRSRLGCMHVPRVRARGPVCAGM